MAASRKRVSILGFIDEAETLLRQKLYEEPRAFLLDAREKARDLPKTNFELGCRFAEDSKWHDALFRFKVVLYLRPDYPQARYNLGCCYFRLGRMGQAVQALKQVLRETPNHQDAIFMLAAIDPEALTPSQRPQTMPREMVSKFFSSVAAEYNTIEADNQYRGGVAVAEQLKPYLPADALTVVDLGCGTGIAAMPLRAQAGQMIGVDVTVAMATQAEAAMVGERKLYDRVIAADLAALGDTIAAESADLVLMVNVAPFVGALERPLMTAVRMLKPNGILALTVEPYKAMDSFGLVAKTGRFGHGNGYVNGLAASLELRRLKQGTFAMYPGADVELFLFAKSGN